jgi:hypothetical protein
MINLDPKAWRNIAAKFKVKDLGLEKALTAVSDNLKEDAHDARLKAISTVTQLAGTLRKTREVVAVPPLLKYLADLSAAAEAAKNEVTKQKLAAAKEAAEAEKAKGVAAKAQAVEEKAKAEAAKEQAEAKKRDADAANEKEGQGDKHEGDFKAILLSLLAKVKSARPDAPYQYLLCEAKPFPFLIFAKQINASHRKMLEKLSGGSKRFLKPGVVTFNEGHYCFESDKDIPGLARRVQGFLKNVTGRKFAVMFGTQKATDEDDPAVTGAIGDDAADTPAAVAQEAGAAARGKPEPEKTETEAPPKPNPELTKGTEEWTHTCNSLVSDVKALGKTIQARCAGEPAQFTKEIDGHLAKLETQVGRFGRRFGESLTKANQAATAAARKSELTRAKVLMADTIKEIKPLAVIIDGNPFMKTNFTGKLSGGLNLAAKAITGALAVAEA